jgi:lysophospholipase L1-like esterase
MTKRRIFRYIVCCVLFFAVWEICARVDDHIEDGAPLFGNYAMSAMLTHDDYGVVGRPYGHFGRWKLNALGYRGPDIHPGTQKIICIGASETFGMSESVGMEYPRQLERAINSRQPDLHVEVVNVAYAGQSLRTLSHRIDSIVDTLSPRVAILYPSFLGYINDASIGQPDQLDWIREPKGFHSRIEEKLLSSIDRMPQWAENIRFRYHIWRALRKNKVIVNTIPESHVEQFRSDLRAVLDRLQERHVRPVLVTHATVFGKSVLPTERYMLIAWRRFEPNLADDGWLDAERRMNAVIRQEARERHLTLVEAADALSGPQNFSDWVHFTNQGANKMANLIADKLIAPESDNSDQLQSLEDARSLDCSEAGSPGPRHVYVRANESRKGSRVESVSVRH